MAPSDTHARTGRDASPALTIRDLVLRWGARTYVMAVLNVTPDSFSGDGLGRDVDAALAEAEKAIAGGADILDVGGESTRPGATVLSAAEETERVVPVVAALRARFDVPISIDTYKAAVARASLDEGADLVNDVWGLRADREMAPLVAEREVPVILMHNRSDPAEARIADILGGHYVGVHYDNLLRDVRVELSLSVEIALASDVRRDRIIVDPGIGFGKTVAQNLELIDRLGDLRALGYPVLVGPSRKSFIGLTLDLPPDQRLEGTASAVAAAIVRGADIVRVHDVRAMTRVARMTDAIVRRPPPPA